MHDAPNMEGVAKALRYQCLEFFMALVRTLPINPSKPTAHAVHMGVHRQNLFAEGIQHYAFCNFVGDARK